MSAALLYDGFDPILRILVVGCASYLALLAMLRAAGQRSLAHMDAFDLVITIALGSTLGRLITADGVTLSEAVTAFAVLLGLQLVISRLRSRSSRIEAVVSEKPVLLFYRGRFIRDRMQHHRLVERDLYAAARGAGVGSLDEVEALVLESTGDVSVVKTSASTQRSTLAPVLGAGEALEG